MKRLILGIHNHQPVGNFDHVIAEAYDRAYRPFLDLLGRHPSVPVAMHVTGPLVEWLKLNRPDYLDDLGQLVASGQVEPVSGAYWEPILSVLSPRDQAAQIQRMNREVESLFGVRPRGCWLAERIWEPQLPSILAGEGLEWVALDDSHFLAAGFDDAALDSYFITEDGGRDLAVFPISRRLRYLIPFHPVEKVLDHLRDDQASVSVMMDDGEKFGVWSSTDQLCYGEGYLDRLFTALAAQSGLRLSGFSSTLDDRSPAGRAYLPTGSYFEMGEWSLPLGGQLKMKALAESATGIDEELLPYVRGGFWRNFLVKYEESNWMHKRMMRVSRLLAEAEDIGAELPAARDLLLQSQCNCAYWHGLFGGLYLPHLRHAIYDSLLAAEAALGRDEWMLECEDLDHDGREEVIWSSPACRCFIKPASGGRIREIDSLLPPFALTNTLTRREENYHSQVAAAGRTEDATRSIHDAPPATEDGLEHFLGYDPHERFSLEDQFFPADTAEPSFGKGWLDLNGDAFTLSLPDDAHGEITLALTRSLGEGREVELIKRLRFADEGRTLEVRLTIGYRGPERLESVYASGWNLNLLAPEADDRYFLIDDKRPPDFHLRSKGWNHGPHSLSLVDEWSGLAIRFSGEGLGFYREPIETVSLSDAGFERVYQGSWIALTRQLSLADGEYADFSYRLEMQAIADRQGG